MSVRECRYTGKNFLPEGGNDGRGSHLPPHSHIDVYIILLKLMEKSREKSPPLYINPDLTSSTTHHLAHVLNLA